MADRVLNETGPARALPRVLMPLLAVLAATLAGALGGCEAPPPPPGFERVVLDGQTYTLEVAADDDTRTKGLGMRESLPENGGMLFVFRRPARRHFIMRDCLIPIDIIFLDANGRVTAMHHMPIEEPRGEGEGTAGDWDPRKAENRRYESRLARYTSGGAAQFVIEIMGGELETLDLQKGQQIDLDVERLKRLAR